MRVHCMCGLFLVSLPRTCSFFVRSDVVTQTRFTLFTLFTTLCHKSRKLYNSFPYGLVRITSKYPPKKKICAVYLQKASEAVSRLRVNCQAVYSGRHRGAPAKARAEKTSHLGSPQPPPAPPHFPSTRRERSITTFQGKLSHCVRRRRAHVYACTCALKLCEARTLFLLSKRALCAHHFTLSITDLGPHLALVSAC